MFGRRPIFPKPSIKEVLEERRYSASSTITNKKVYFGGEVLILHPIDKVYHEEEEDGGDSDGVKEGKDVNKNKKKIDKDDNHKNDISAIENNHSSVRGK